MIHVDVMRDTSAPQETADYHVQTSVDGGRWTTQYIVSATAGTESMNPEWRKREAESTARIFVNGCRFAGAEVRATSGGYAL